MDIKVLNLDKNKLLQFNNMSVKDKDKYLTQSLYPGLGLRVIVQDYQLTDDKFIVYTNTIYSYAAGVFHVRVCTALCAFSAGQGI